MHTYANWLAQLDSESLGRLWLLKFRYDLSNGNIPGDIEQTLQALVEAKLPAPPDSALHILEAVIKENPNAFDLVGLRNPPNGPEYSLVVRFEIFAIKYLNRALIPKFDESNEQFDKIWNDLGKTITSKFYRGSVQTDRDFFWCAPKETIEEIATSCTPKSSLAATLRDRLGLNKMAQGQRLVLIDVPSTALAGKKLRAPTTLDSGVNPVFVPCNEQDGYGRTFNLRTGLRDVREVVVEKIPFNETFGAEKLGSVDAPVPSISWTAIETLIQ